MGMRFCILKERKVKKHNDNRSSKQCRSPRIRCRDNPTPYPQRNVELADQLNEQLGVNMWQRQAMEVGSMRGWDVPGADPAKYQEDYGHQMGGMTLG